ncbi:MAG: polyamine aminopropyltransferase [Bacillota bacterium]|nr:polyamine aminopropyltransferase [Bacillota bacterium]
MRPRLDVWFTEEHAPGLRFSMRVTHEIVRRRSEFQEIAVLETQEFGKVLILDGYLMVTEKDEFIYHEMIVHVPLAVHPDIRRVLVVGGGDGGAVRELARYDTIEEIDLVEIDPDVIDVSEAWLPQLSEKLRDPRVTIHFADGVRFMRQVQRPYDLIIIDSTDPFGPGEGLFTREFYGSCHAALTEDGILINQHESLFYEEYRAAMRRVHDRLSQLFPVARVYQAHIPTYPSGHWLFGFSSKRFDPLLDLDAEGWLSRGIRTNYYNPDLHRGAFALPNYIRRELEGGRRTRLK